MAKFRFVGNGDHDPKTMVAFGYTFKLDGAPVEVTNPDHVRKLQGNSHFVEVRVSVDKLKIKAQ